MCPRPRRAVGCYLNRFLSPFVQEVLPLEGGTFMEKSGPRLARLRGCGFLPEWARASLNSSMLLAAASLYFLFSTYFNTVEFTLRDLRIILGHVVFLLIVQGILLSLLYKATHSKRFLYGMTALFTLMNAFSLNIIFISSVINLGWMLVPIGIVVWLLLFITAKGVNESTQVRWLVLSINLLVLISMPINASFSKLRTADDDEFTASPKVRKVDFVSKPDVYLIGFEAMQPAAVLSKYLRLTETPHADAFERLGFRRLKNLFAEMQPSQRSFNSLLSLDHGYYRLVENQDTHLFQGFVPSPFIQIFKHNGYEVSTLYSNGFFGEGKGPYIDNYVINEEFSACSFMEGYEKRFALFGICKLNGTRYWPMGKLKSGKPIEFLIDYMDKIYWRSAPQLLIAHIRPLGHLSQKTFRNTKEEIDEFRKRYHALSVQAAVNLQRIVDHMRESPKDTILYVFGDHGIFLSGKLPFKGNEVFVVQDRYAIQGGIYPKSACTLYFDTSKKHLTSPEVARLIINCLSGTDPMDPSYKHTVRIGRHLNLSEFLYE